MSRYVKYTDVRHVIKTAVDLRILLRKLLTPTQLALFQYQRERLEKIDTNSSSDEKTIEVQQTDSDTFGPSANWRKKKRT